MTKIFLIFNNEIAKSQVNSSLSKKTDIEFVYAEGLIDDILVQINNFSPDIILLENGYENSEFLIRQIKSNAKNQNTQIILILNKILECNFMNLADGLIECPIDDNVLLSTIESHCKIKKSLDRLYENNKELSRSLYQLNVLYNTSSQFTGTLNTSKLYEIMLEAMEKTLSFDIASVLVFNSESKPVFILNTTHTPSDNLIDALKIRSILNYSSASLYNPSYIQEIFSDVEVKQKIKQTRSNKIFGIESIGFDSLYAPIKIGDEFFGVVELFRQNPFLPEDVTCFQAIAHQVALPLRSAKLYEEISVTNKKLEKLEKLKSEFVSIVSHELRTPLTPINNSLDIVLSEQTGKISPDAKNFISMAKRNIQRLSGIIEDLLDLSRIQTGKLDFKYKNVDITPSLELLQKTFTPVAKEKGIEISLCVEEKLPNIYADSRRIEQIVSNLVSNSLKFTTKDGNIIIKASVVDSSSIEYDELIMPYISKLNGKYIKISVSDDGIGIKKEDIPKIFDKFSQIESSLNRNKGGVGLGLTITKQLIDSHLGVIRVVSEEQKGSTFEVYLPLISDLNMFIMDLSHALTSSDEVGVLNIKYKKELNIVQKLKENNILNLTKMSHQIVLEDDEYINYYAFIPKITLNSFDAFYCGVLDFCTKTTQEKYDIILNKAHSTKSGCDAIKIMRLLTGE